MDPMRIIERQAEVAERILYLVMDGLGDILGMTA
jgi:hypothetical protein